MGMAAMVNNHAAYYVIFCKNGFGVINQNGLFGGRHHAKTKNEQKARYYG